MVAPWHRPLVLRLAILAVCAQRHCAAERIPFPIGSVGRHDRAEAGHGAAARIRRHVAEGGRGSGAVAPASLAAASAVVTAEGTGTQQLAPRSAGGKRQATAEDAAARTAQSSGVRITLRTFGGAPLWAWLYLCVSCTAGPLLWAAAAIWMPTNSAQLPVPPVAGKEVAPHPRVAYLDLWRVLCVFVVVVSHAGEAYDKYAEYNVFAVQQWVLPVIMLVAGKCFAMSSLPTVHYVARLLTYLAVGSLLNWLSAVVTGFPWWDSIETRGVTFQMGFVLTLAVAVVGVAPLKRALRAEASATGAITGLAKRCICLAVVGKCVLIGYRLVKGADGFGSELPRAVIEAAATVMLALVGKACLPKSRLDLLGWLLLAWIYVTRVLHAEPRPGTELHLLDLFTFALVVHVVPLRAQESVAAGFTSWWPVIFVGCGMLQHPGLKQRLDLLPSPDVLDRARQYLVEFTCVLAFTTIPSLGPERSLRVPDVRWLNGWALFAYCAHYAVYRLLPGGPGILLVLAPALLPAVAPLLRWRRPQDGCWA